MANLTEVRDIHATFSSLSPTQITMIASAVGAVIAALVAAFFSLITTWITKRIESKRALQELIVKSAIELHSNHIEFTKNQGGAILPIDAYIVYLIAITDVLLEKRLTEKTLSLCLIKLKILQINTKNIKKSRVSLTSGV